MSENEKYVRLWSEKYSHLVQFQTQQLREIFEPKDGDDDASHA